MNPNQQPQNPVLPPAGPPQPGFSPTPGPQIPQQQPGFSPQPAQQPFQQPASAPPQQPFSQPNRRQFAPGRPTSQIASMPGMPGQQAETYGADYLDQIAPGPSGPKFFSGSFTWILIGLAVAFMFGVGIISLFSGKSNTTTAQTLYDRYYYMLQELPNYHRFIKSTKLAGTDSDLKIFMTNAQNDLVDPMSANGLTLKQLDKTIKADQKTYVENVIAKLEDARLNATLDRNYASEMAYQSQLILDMYTKMSKSNSKSISDTAKKAIPNLQPIQKAFADFNPDS